MLLVGTAGIKAQIITATPSAREAALGGCLLLNPAENCAEATVAVPFGLTEMAEKSIAVQAALGQTATARIDYAHLGASTWHEQTLAARMAVRVAKGWHVGASLCYWHMGTNDAHYTTQQHLGGEALVRGVQGRTEWVLAAGWHPWKLAAPYSLLLQTGYRPVQTAVVYAGLQWAQRLHGNLAVEWNYEQRYFLRAGFSTTPSRICLGAGWRWQRMQADIAFSTHNRMGLSPATTIKVWF